MLRDQNTKDHSLRNFIVSFNEKDYPPINVRIAPLKTFMHEHSKEEYSWARLNKDKCPCCPLNENRYCPAAISIASVLNPFRNYFSIESVTIEAEDRVGRKTFWTTDLQTALFTLIRTAMFFSGCPVTEEFRIFLEDLRPLATEKEIHKALVIRFLLAYKGEKKIAKVEINKRISDLHCINLSLAKRICSNTKGDAIINSLVHADAVGLLLAINFDEIYQEICDEINTIEQSRIMHK